MHTYHFDCFEEKFGDSVTTSETITSHRNNFIFPILVHGGGRETEFERVIERKRRVVSFISAIHTVLVLICHFFGDKRPKEIKLCFFFWSRTPCGPVV